MRLSQQVHSKIEGKPSGAWWTVVLLPQVPRAGEHVVIWRDKRLKFTITVMEVFHHIKTDPVWGNISIALVPVTVSEILLLNEMTRDFQAAGWTFRSGFWSESA